MANGKTPYLAGAPAREDEFRGTARYEVLGCLGRGGMGIVYEVFDRQRRERVALKTLRRFDAAGLYRFKQEFRTLADVLHPNLVHLHELVASDRDELLFTMELVEGSDFLEHVHHPGTARAGEHTRVVALDSEVRLARRADEPPGDAPAADPPARIATPADLEKLRPALRQLVDGVRALHLAGKLHRDIKPSNVRVTPEGRVVLLDFGVATEMRRRASDAPNDDEIVGTVAYMAPEQASGEAPAAASDWYAVGALLYEALVGRPPFTGSALEVLTLKYTVTPLAPSACVDGVPDDLDALCIALLASDPEGRPDAHEILRRLGAAAPSHNAPAPRTTDAPPATALVGRERQLRDLRAALDGVRRGASVSVRVSGRSGLGKSAVVHHFLDAVEREGAAVVLRGRAYERESVPYKAVDSVVDALTRHLLERQDRPEAIDLPAEVWALAHVFPVLRRVRSIDEIPAASVGDPIVVRQRAFVVLREVFHRLAKRQPVVVFIDDVQWGDADSASLLVELMRPPAAPAMLLVTTHRSEDAETSPFLADIRARWPEDAEVREIEIAPLDHEAARRLALAHIGADDPAAQRSADAVAKEAGGSPFLVEELARTVSAYHRIEFGDAIAERASVTLEQVLGDRAARLPEDARRFLEVVAVGGRPLPVATIGAAADSGERAAQLVALLRARRFVRVGLRDGTEMVEASHGRVRETIVARLASGVAQRHHAHLARVLEATPEADPEAIAAHLLGAGDKERAAHYAERAAEQAVAKLAFAQASRLYELTLDTLGRSSAEAPRLARRLAETAQWAGHAEKAARAYLFAAESAPRTERIDLERAAAAQLIAAGLIDEGAAVCRRVMDAVGRRIPDSPLATIFWVVVYRVVAAVVMARKTLVEPRELSPEELVRLEALQSIQRAFAVVDPLSALYVKARYLADAFRTGSRMHVIRASAAQASSLASRGGPEGKLEKRLWTIARDLSKSTGDQAGYGLYLITHGCSLYLRGHWRAAVDVLDPTCAKLAAMRQWNANASVYSVYALSALGEMREVKARTTRLLAEAEQRGDLYTAVNLRASHPMAAWLADDDVEGARRHLRESMASWSKSRYLVQHWQAMLWEAQADLYAGEPARAADRIARDARPLKRSRMFSAAQLIRVFTHDLQGRVSAAMLDGVTDDGRRQRLAEVRKAQGSLAGEGLPWAAPLAEILRAWAERAAGHDEMAAAALRSAVDLAEKVKMAVHAAAARRQLGALLGGPEGEAMAREAEATLREKGVRAPARYAQLLVPGRWSNGG